MVRITSLSNFFMLLLLIILFTISMSNAYPTIITSEGEKWDPVIGPEAYKDEATGPEWITFKREISPGNWNSIIENDVDGMINFKWKSDKVIGNRSSFRSIKFYRNSVTNELSLNHDTKGDSWEIVDPFEYNKENRSRLDFIFNAFGATIWIAFPLQPVQTSPVLIQNRPPNRPKHNISSDVTLLVNETLCILAIATDPDNDSIDLIWEWGDGRSDKSQGISSGDNVTQCHSWKEARNYTIVMTARDSMGYNNSSTINVNVSLPAQPINASVLVPPTKPKFNISSDGFLWSNYDLFISTSSTDPNNDSINYSWMWGDRTPDGMSEFVPSGNDTIQYHSYREPVDYTITITASTQKGNSSSTINLTVMRPKPPETPRGERIGYIGVNYTYSTNLNIGLPIKKVKFLFNITDDVLDPIVHSESNTSAKIIQRWLKHGTKKVKASALDIQGNPGNWSEEINVDIYEPEYVECNQDLQKAIDNASNYTEIILNCNIYNVSKAISIKGKDHFAIKSNVPHASLKNHKSVIAIMSIEESTNINISGLSIEQSANFDNGLISLLRVIDCSYCKIKDCILDIRQNDSGIWIFKGGYNEFENINIERGNTSMGSGIVIEQSLSNLIKNNTFHFPIRIDNFSHIVLKSPIRSNRIIKSDEMQELKITVDGCLFIWHNGMDDLEQTRDQCPMSCDIEINDTELIFG
ncbi:MAG: hypothetical protein NTY37_08910 [Methanothrix sp.]|nr:hypothetical protein [Methanothrix sp.]